MKTGDSGEAKRRRSSRAAYEDPKYGRLGSQPDITRADDIHPYEIDHDHNHRYANQGHESA